jgi:alginate O-acetyltransferase complex protein AlgI
MLFNSYIFIFAFLPITFIIFFGLTRFRQIKAALLWLTVSSLFFYGYGDIASLPILILSIVFNYQIGKGIISAKLANKQAKVLLVIAITFNILLLGYFKYANFFLSSVNPILNTNLNITGLALSPGISFYTFTQIAYLVDIYRGEAKENNSDFLRYTLFVSFFSKLISGPIVRYNELIPQFRQLKRFLFSQKNIALGLTMFSLGLAKKVLIADNISPWVAPVFSNANAVTFLEAWVGALSYTFQLYFDFSGYSDMAIGLGLLFNLYIPINFNSPYKAISISDFWRRWHITLSNFLRDYLYIPLGGSRKGELRRYGNLMATMLLGGLWHGAGWTFVAWGGLHGLYLCINHGWRKLNMTLPKIVGWAITFVAVVISWVLFRAHGFQDGINILQAMIGMKGIVIPGRADGRFAAITELGIQLKDWGSFAYLPPNPRQSFMVLAGLLLSVVFLPNTHQIVEKMKPNWWWAIGIGGLMGYCLLSLNRVSEFLYFQF